MDVSESNVGAMHINIVFISINSLFVNKQI